MALAPGQNVSGTFRRDLQASVIEARNVHVATVLAGGEVLIVGGLDASNGALASAELFQ